jgi:hypothetical protein
MVTEQAWGLGTNLAQGEEERWARWSEERRVLSGRKEVREDVEKLR